MIGLPSGKMMPVAIVFDSLIFHSASRGYGVLALQSVGLPSLIKAAQGDELIARTIVAAGKRPQHHFVASFHLLDDLRRLRRGPKHLARRGRCDAMGRMGIDPQEHRRGRVHSSPAPNSDLQFTAFSAPHLDRVPRAVRIQRRRLHRALSFPGSLIDRADHAPLAEQREVVKARSAGRMRRHTESGNTKTKRRGNTGPPEPRCRRRFV
jgi:hypothetical protein